MYLNARMIAVHTGTGPLATEDPAEAGTAVRGGQCGGTSGGGHITNPALRHYANQAARPFCIGDPTSCLQCPFAIVSQM